MVKEDNSDNDGVLVHDKDKGTYTVVYPDGAKFDFTRFKKDIEKAKNKEIITFKKQPRATKVRAKYSQGLEDYRRHQELCALIDRFSIYVGAYLAPLKDCFMFLSALRSFWLNIRTIQGGAVTDEVDAGLNELDKELLDIREEGSDNVPIETYRKLIELQKRIYYLKQMSGLGFETTIPMTNTERMEEAFLR